MAITLTGSPPDFRHSEVGLGNLTTIPVSRWQVTGPPPDSIELGNLTAMPVLNWTIGSVSSQRNKISTSSRQWTTTMLRQMEWCPAFMSREISSGQTWFPAIFWKKIQCFSIQCYSISSKKYDFMMGDLRTNPYKIAQVLQVSKWHTSTSGDLDNLTWFI